MNFDAYLAGIGAEPSVVHLTADWMQGRAGFGGLVAALVYESMRKQLANNAPVRCLQISFVGPVDDSPFEVSSELIREGKSVAHVFGKGTQNGQTKVLVQGSFGLARESVLSLAAEPLRLSKGPEESTKMPFIKGVMPEFTKQFDFRYATPMPFMKSENRFLEGYVRFAEPTSSVNEAHLLGLVDAWPPTTLPMLSQPCMASSLSWTIEFVHPAPSLGVEEFTQYRAEIMESAGGYAYARAVISNQSGEAIALSQQTTTHFT